MKNEYAEKGHEMKRDAGVLHELYAPQVGRDDDFSHCTSLVVSTTTCGWSTALTPLDDSSSPSGICDRGKVYWRERCQTKDVPMIV